MTGATGCVGYRKCSLFGWGDGMLPEIGMDYKFQGIGVHSEELRGFRVYCLPELELGGLVAL